MVQPPKLAAGDGVLPREPSERTPWLVAITLAALGAGVLIAALSGLFGQRSAPAVPPPPAPVRSVLPSPSAAPSASLLAAARAQRPSARHRHATTIVAQPSSQQQSLDARRFADQGRAHISSRWMEGFYPIYVTAQRTFAVNWLLLASIHRQESAFSTAPSTYHGLNFAGCCGGPMQFNVTNGPVSTWQLVSDSFRYGARPAAYNHMTEAHPSIYDDFDSIMAAARLLSADGAGYVLDSSTWIAAFDYYGHDATGVLYADQVLARAIGWSQHGFCINCDVPSAILEAVHAAYGAPVEAELAAAAASEERARRAARAHAKRVR